jgi:precorrin-4/cobalt-precorrin-4 C11-methyltransferase
MQVLFFARNAARLLLISAGGLLTAQPAAPAPGKFYIVGMGTASDLITVRGQRVIAKADILLAEEGSFATMWAELARGKETWEYPRNFRRFYGADPQTLKTPEQRTQAGSLDRMRRQLIDRIASAVSAGKTVACLQGGDPMMYGMTLFLELLPARVPAEIVPGIGAFQAASAALKASPPYGYDTSAVILTMADWPGRVDPNDKLLATGGSTLVVYTMGLDYPAFFAQLKQAYPPETPVAIVSDAGNPALQRVVRSTVGQFLQEVEFSKLPKERHLLFVGKFLTAGQARKDALAPRLGAAPNQ